MNPLQVAILILCLGGQATGAVANAQATTGTTGKDATATSGTSGAQLANNGASPVAACASCHGARGDGNAGAGFPRLAGQSQQYLGHQLAAYASGARNHPVMSPIAKGLTLAQMTELAAYYAGLDAPTGQAGPAGGAAATSATADKRGEALATVGDQKLGVQACANCHGPGGAGEWPAYPYLSGQHASYLSAALVNWKNGSRNTDPSQQMASIAKRLGDTDITALANYYAAQRPPSLAELQPNVAAGTVARPVPGVAVRGGPQKPIPTSGVGSEQGSPTTGGAQGIGGGGAASGSGSQGSPGGSAPK